MTRIKTFKLVLWMLALTLGLSACGYLIQPKVVHGVEHMHSGAFKLDPTHTTVLFKVDHMGLSTFVGRFDQVTASLDFDPQNMANSKLSAIIDVSSLDLSNKPLETSLRGSDWFDTARFPQASFVTRSVTLIDASHANYSGDFTFHGVTKPLILSVEFRGAGDNLLTGRYTLGFSAKAQIKRSEFGMDYLVPAVSDLVDVEVFAEFQKN